MTYRILLKVTYVRCRTFYLVKFVGHHTFKFIVTLLNLTFNFIGFKLLSTVLILINSICKKMCLVEYKILFHNLF